MLIEGIDATISKTATLVPEFLDEEVPVVREHVKLYSLLWLIYCTCKACDGIMESAECCSRLHFVLLIPCCCISLFVMYF